MTETQISKLCGEFLTLNHIPNWRTQVLKGRFQGHGEKRWRHVETGTAGLSDRVFIIPDGRTAYLEIKKPGGLQSKEQKDFEKMCVDNNVPYHISTSIEDLKEILEAYGMLRVKF